MQNPPESFTKLTATLWSRKKIALWFFGVGGGFFLALAIALLAYDEKLQPYDDLNPTRTETPDARTNGYLFLRERWENLPDGDKKDSNSVKDMVFGNTSWDDTLVARMRVGREQLAGELKEALALPAYLPPQTFGINDPDFPRFAWIARPFKYLGMNVLERARAGDRAAAISLLGEMHGLSVRHIGCHGSLISLLVGIAINQMTVNLTCELLAIGGFNANELAALAEMWNLDLPAQEVWRSAMRSEAAFNESAIIALKKNRKDLPETMRVRFSTFLLKPNLTLNRMHDQIRHLSGVALKTFPSLAAANAAEWGGVADHRSKLMKYLDPNFAGSQLLYGTDTLQKILPGLRCGTLFYPRAVRVAIAMHRWRLAHPGQWPATLEELVPEYLSAVPEDPFNGLPLRWDRASRIIYSVGADWKPDVPLPPKADQSWSLKEHASPVLRLTRDPAVPSPPPGVPK